MRAHKTDGESGTPEMPQSMMNRILNTHYQYKPGDEDSNRCLHRQCTQCHGTGRKDNGQPCVHAISCPCPRCRAGH